MSNKGKKTTSSIKDTSNSFVWPRFLWGICFVLLGILLTVSFFDYNPGQNPWLTTNAMMSNPQYKENLVGQFGVLASFWSQYAFGLGAWEIPILAFFLGFQLVVRRANPFTIPRSFCWLTSLLSLACLGTILKDTFVLSHSIFHNYGYFGKGSGGFWGELIFAQFIKIHLGVFGGSLLVSALFIISTTYGFSLFSLYKKIFYKLIPSLKQVPARLQSLLQWSTTLRKVKVTPDSVDPPLKNLPPKANKAQKSLDPASLPLEQTEFLELGPSKLIESKKAVQAAGLKIVAIEPTKKANNTLPKHQGNYVFPGQDLLNKIPENNFIDPTEHEQTANELVATLAQFGIEVTPSEVHTGPVLTRYEVKPAPGVRVEKILSLEKNIALALRAHSVRILAPVPGKDSVGIEIPNKRPAAVTLREIIESTAWSESKAEIPLVLGKEVTGKPIVQDLTRMPHLLIAGSTGSGKTVCINTIIASLLYHSSPKDIRFIMVDPKIVEMQLYNSLPHMLIPVVTDPKRVPGALKWLLKEMEHRYQIFAKANVRNIAGFNAKILQDLKEREKAEELEAELSPEERAALSTLSVPRDESLELPKEKLPYIVCIVDELADLMMVAPADIETGIARLAQLARAAGIHLIIATQRPSVNVITGVIKANLPSRIAFKVASKVDSRTILDGGGADQLIGRGDMLFIPPGTSQLVRAQGAFVSDEEIEKIVEALKVNGPPLYAESIQQAIDAESGETSGSGVEGEWEDDLIPQAIEIIRTSNRASASLLQRRLKIGYNRAARIMDILEDSGIVGPDNGANPREILE